ncbi:MAG: transporter substrate-binding domain-containing protein [Rhodospirillales bacterium]|nr:MAG: transporter substrate-binding domain-containing protein [Rhodospirillales bacterium]
MGCRSKINGSFLSPRQRSRLEPPLEGPSMTPDPSKSIALSKWRASLAACLLILMHGTAPAVAAERLTLSTGMVEPWTTGDHQGFTDLLIPRLFKRLGLEADLVVNRAAARAITLANDGVDDGIAARIIGLEEKYPNLVRVPEPIFVNDFVACTLDKAPAKADWDSIVPFSVSHIIGWQIFERNLKPVRELLLAKDSEQMFSLLKAGKAELILHERWQALWHANQLGLKLKTAEPPLARVEMFIYMHQRHKDLVPRIARELAAMKTDGTYQQIAGQAFKGLGQTARLEP